MNIKNIMLTAFAILGLAMLTTPATQAQTCDGSGGNFVDLDGDGYNDNAPDFDGDGIPNGLDDDYVKPEDGSGGNFVDIDGDGFNDNAPDYDGDGIPNGLDDDYVKPEDGTGYKKGKLGENQGLGMSQIKTQKFNRLKSFNGNMFQKRINAIGAGSGVSNGTGEGIVGSGECDGTGPNGKQNKGGGGK